MCVHELSKIHEKKLPSNNHLLMLEQNFGATGIEGFKLTAIKYHYILHYSLLVKLQTSIKKATVQTKGKPIFESSKYNKPLSWKERTLTGGNNESYI